MHAPVDDSTQRRGVEKRHGALEDVGQQLLVQVARRSDCAEGE